MRKEPHTSRFAHASGSRARCYWFSGTPGTHVRQALASLSEEFKRRGRSAECVSIEDEIKHSYARLRFPNNSTQRRETTRELDTPGGFKQILDQAPDRVQELWSEAAELAGKRASEHLRQGSDVFLTFHAVFYADKFGDFYSPVDGSVVSSLPRPHKFITFIDDIGDIATRLRTQGQVFANREKIGLASVKAAIRDLLTVLEWRATELTVSRLIGSYVDCSPFVLAVKHPVQTAARILLDEGTPTYVSHSISEPRRTFEKKGAWPPFMGELQRFTDALARSAHETNNHTNAIPIVPTSIDERRFKAREIQDIQTDQLLLPDVLDRWDLPKDTPLVGPPPDWKTQNWLDPRAYFRGRLENDLTPTTRREVQTLDGLLSALLSRIDNQINARDHTLVAQCPVLLVYRPYVAWRVSGGVAAEVTHQRKRLSREGKQRRTVIFFHRKADDNFRKLGMIIERSRLFRWVRGATPVTDKEVMELLKEGMESDFPLAYTATDIRTCVERILSAQGIVGDGPRNLAEGEVLGKTTSADIEAATERLWNQAAKDVIEGDPWKSDADSWIVEDLTPEQFAEKLNDILADQRQFSEKAKRKAKKKTRRKGQN